MKTIKQAPLFETSFDINIGENMNAVNFRGRWEVYYRNELGIEMFSHFATPGESLQFYTLARRAV